MFASSCIFFVCVPDLACHCARAERSWWCRVSPPPPPHTHPLAPDLIIIMSPPRPISGSAGSRVKVSLGATGDDYLYFFDEDDGSTKWQSRRWAATPGGLPSAMAKQLNNCIAKGRIIEEAAFRPDDEWYVSGSKLDGTGTHHSWWDGCDQKQSRNG